MTSLQTKPVAPQIGPPKPKTTIQQDIQNFLDSIKDFFQGILDFFKSLFGAIGNFFKSLFSYRWFVVIALIFVAIMLLKKR